MTGSIREALESTYHPNIRLIRALEKPVIAAVNGPAAGAGLSLAAACDVRIASEAASFVPGFVGIGLVPDSGGSWFIHRLLGFARALEWMSSNRRLDAARGAGLGARLGGDPRRRVRAAGGGDRVVRGRRSRRGRSAMTKRLFEHAHDASLESQLELEAELQQEAVATADFGEGVTAFLEKREPSFTGS